MDRSLPPPRHAPPHIRINASGGGDVLEMQPTSSSSESQARSISSRSASTRSLIPQARPTAPSSPRQPASSVYGSQTPAGSTEQLLLPPRKSRSRRYRDEDSPISRRTSWSSASDGSRESGFGGPFGSPFADSRAPSRAGSDDEGVNTQTVSEKYNILPSAGLLLFPEDVEKDDWLHTPSPNDKDGLVCADLFSKRGLVNLGALGLITLGLLVLFIGYPILTFARTLTVTTTSCTASDCLSTDLPLLKNVRTGLIDPDTPSSAKTKKGINGKDLTLVFSDEFNDDGRTFYEDDDAYFQAVDLWYGVTEDLEWYDPDAITTENGVLVIRFDAFQNHDLNYRSGMLQSWNQMCFKSGLVEASISLPGAGDVEGFWPGWWTMGNLGRPGYAATTQGMWPYTYHDECDVGITANQSQIDGLSFLPGMKMPACLCSDGDDNPSPGVSRGAPEIDCIEASVLALNGDEDNQVGSASQSLQVAPFDIWWQPDAEYQMITDYAVTSPNSYQGGEYQEALSVVTNLNNNWYNGKEYQTYGFEYEPGSDGFVQWYVGDLASWQTKATAVRPNGNVGQRVIPEEPLALVVNFGMSTSFASIDVPKIEKELPARMRIDYIRIYQDEDGEVTCDPEGYPTTAYIANHPEPYADRNMTLWSETAYDWPKNSYVDGCTAATSKRTIKRSERRALRRRQEAEAQEAKLQRRSTSWWPWS